MSSCPGHQRRYTWSPMAKSFMRPKVQGPDIRILLLSLTVKFPLLPFKNVLRKTFCASVRL